MKQVVRYLELFCQENVEYCTRFHLELYKDDTAIFFHMTHTRYRMLLNMTVWFLLVVYVVLYTSASCALNEQETDANMKPTSVKIFDCINRTDEYQRLKTFCQMLSNEQRQDSTHCSTLWGKRYENACKLSSAAGVYARHMLKVDMDKALKPVHPTYEIQSNKVTCHTDPMQKDTIPNDDFNLHTFAQDLLKVLSSVLVCVALVLVCVIGWKRFLITSNKIKTYACLRAKTGSVNLVGFKISTGQVQVVEPKFQNNCRSLIGLKEARVNISHEYQSSSAENEILLELKIDADTGQDVDPKPRKNFQNVKLLQKPLSQYNSKATTETSSTQTSGEKSTNIRNSIGRRFCQKSTLDKNRRTLQLNNSDAILTLSEKDVSEGAITCHASTFRNLSEIYDKLGCLLRENEQIASPAIEYFVLNKPKLEEFAKVEMPFIGSPKSLRILKIVSEQCQRVAPNAIDVLEKGKVDLENPNLVAYYEIIAPGKVSIYTKSFSWLVCTTCDERQHSFNLRVLIYGSLRRLSERNQRAAITMYIIDDIFQIADYEQHITEEENRNNRRRLQNRPIDLPETVAQDDYLKIKLTVVGGTEPTKWKPKMDIDMGEPIKKMEQVIRLDQITQCHKFRSNGLPFATDWLLENREDLAAMPFEFLIKVECHSKYYPRERVLVTASKYFVDNLLEDNAYSYKPPVHHDFYGIEESNNGAIAQPVSGVVVQQPASALRAQQLHARQPSSAIHVQPPRIGMYHGSQTVVSAHQNVRGEMDQSLPSRVNGQQI